MAEALRNSDDGLITYTFARPGDTQAQPKVAYVARFRPWDLVFAAGAYTDDLETAFGPPSYNSSDQRRDNAADVGGLLAGCRDITGSLGRLRSPWSGSPRAISQCLLWAPTGAMRSAKWQPPVQVFKDNAVEMERLKAEKKEAGKAPPKTSERPCAQLASDFEAR